MQTDTMRTLTTEETNTYLSSIGMQVGDWNQITSLCNEKRRKPHWLQHRAPRDSQELFCFSSHVAGWLPKGSWKLFQIDNSTNLNPIQKFLVNRALNCVKENQGFPRESAFLFEFCMDSATNANTELLISYLVFLFLLFECHGHITSSNSFSGERLSIQDGFVYFFSDEENISGAESMLKSYGYAPLTFPAWVHEIIVRGQE